MAMAGIPVVQYFATKLRLAKEAGFTGVTQQLLAIWNGLDVEIREHIDEPDEHTSIDRFRRKLEDQERFWREKAARSRVSTFNNAQRWNSNSSPYRTNDRPYSGQRMGQQNYQGERYRSDGPAQARITAPPQRLQITTGPANHSPNQSNRAPPRQTSWTPGRRACSKCGGSHMDWEHNYYQNNPTDKGRPTKAYYLHTLQHGMSDYSPQDVEDCIQAFHAAEADETRGTAERECSDTPRGRSETPDYPPVGGSSWFANYDEPDENGPTYNVAYHHLDSSTNGVNRDLDPGPHGPGETVDHGVAYRHSSSKPYERRGHTDLDPGPHGPGETADPVATRLRSDSARHDRRDLDPGPHGPGETVDLDVICRHLDGSPQRELTLTPKALFLPRKFDLNPPAAPVATGAWQCRNSRCNLTFPSRNKLHRHLRETSHFTDFVEPPKALFSSTIKPKRQPDLGSGFAFRGFRFTEVRIRAAPEAKDHWICADSGCGMSVADEGWFRQTFPEAHIATMPTPVRISGIGSDAHVSNLYSVVPVYVLARRDSKDVLVILEVEVHLVQGLKCHMLVGVDMLAPYQISLDFETSKMNIGSCNASADLRTKSLSSPIHHRKVKVTKRIVVPPYSRRAIPVAFKAFTHDRDINFRPSYSQSTCHLAHAGAFLESVCSNATESVLYHNKTDRPVIVSRNATVGEMADFDVGTECHLLESEVVNEWGEAFMSSAERHAFVFDNFCAATGLHLSAEAFAGIGDRVPMATEEKIADAMGESILDDIGPGEITSSIDDIKFGPDLTPEQLLELKELVKRFRVIWERTDGVVNEPPENWLKIRLKPGADLKSRGVYRLGSKDRAVVDELFDKLTAEGKMSRSKGSNPVGWGVFVVRTGKPGDKGRVVVDTRGLNAAAKDDAYPLPRQEDVMAIIKFMLLMSLLNQVKSYYQRLLDPPARPLTAVVTHRGQEEFNVVLLGFKGSPGHQQRFMDDFLEEFAECVACYIDDMIAESKSFRDHVNLLERLFTKMEGANLALNPKKCFIGFIRIQLLGHVVDRFGIYTLEAKTAAIREMSFPTNLAELEYFLGLTGFCRQFVPFYAVRAGPLRQLAKELTKAIRRPDQRCSVKADTVPVPPPTSEQLESFQQLKEALSSEQFLVHDDAHVPLMMSVDASYEFGFGVTVYQVPAETMEENGLSAAEVCEGKYDRRLERVVMFLSKELSPAETSYWPTELETSASVFAVKKTCHLVEANDFPTIIHTDHVAMKHIAHSTSLKTTSPERANMRLIRASQYLSQFRLDVRYRPGKDNIPADALSRIKRIERKADIFTADADIIPDQDRAEGAHSIIQISAALAKRWAEALKDDRHYRTIYAELREKLAGTDQDRVESYGWTMNMVQGHPLLFVQKGDDGLPACIPYDMAKHVVKAAHDPDHPGIEGTFARIRDHFYMPGLSALVRSYVGTCPECARKRTARHKPYGTLHPITPPVNPFDMLTIDFIVKLPDSSGYDSVLTATDKVSKAVIFSPGKETWTAAEWADVFLKNVVRR